MIIPSPSDGPYTTASLTSLLDVADLHPFYNADVQYPPAWPSMLKKGESEDDPSTYEDLQMRPLLWKKDLYAVIQRLINDKSPENEFRHNVYTSITGGGGTSSSPLFFATDSYENRSQRHSFGGFLGLMGLVSHRDWVVTVHTAGELYRSLDLTLELLENAGASVLAAGSHMKAADVIKLVVQYHANVLSGDASQMVQLAHYISTLSAEERAAVCINKIIYTSEGLAPSQRDFILSVLGPVEICSILGSAEAGPFAVSCPHLIDAEPVGQTPSYRDFVYDTRLTLIEVVRPQEPGDRSPPVLLGPNEFGMIVQTSFSRLKHPLVRYVTGDIGAVRELPEHARPRVLQKSVPFLRVLRLQGRDHRFSFPWDGDYIEFDGLAAILDEPGYAVLQWQVVLDKMETSAEAAVEVRLLRLSVEGAERPSGENLEGSVRTYFKVTGENEHRFKIVYVDDLDGFVRSGTGRKVTKFVNRLD